MAPAIETSGLVRRFGATVAVDHVDLCIETGDVFGFLGHNGAGKTTTVRLLNGVLDANEGAATVLGMDTRTDGARIRAHTGVLTETPALDERLTARKTLELYADIYGVPRPNVKQRVTDLLELFDLADRGGDKVGSFSKGMRQRMALARTIVHHPDILFLDEPTAALDPVATRDVHQLIRRASQLEGRTVFLCTHNLYEAQRLCTRVAVLAHGKVLATGSPSELARQYGTAQRVRFEVDREQLMDATRALQAMRWDPTVAPGTDGPGDLLVQGIPRDDVPEAIAALVQEGIRIFEVTQEEATLEDVYFALQEPAAEQTGNAKAQVEI